MLLSEPINLAFRGSRHYWHGTDIYNHLMERIQSIGIQPVNIRLKFRSLTTLPGILNIAKVSDVSSMAEIARSQFEMTVVNQEDERIAIWFSQDKTLAKKPEREQVEHDNEAIIIAACTQDTERSKASSKHKAQYKPIETIVFTTKALHYNLMPCTPEELWVFSGLLIPSPLAISENNSVTAQIESRRDDASSVTKIMAEQTEIATVYFTKLKS